jgi:putative ABC transport system ATP-binding protein
VPRLWHGDSSHGSRRCRLLTDLGAINRRIGPDTVFDAGSGETVMGLLRRMADGPIHTTVLTVTDDWRLLDRADRIVNMVDGRIVSKVRPRELVKIIKVLQ